MHVAHVRKGLKRMSTVSAMVRQAARCASTFKRDERGSLTAFAVVLFVIMLVGAGMAVDFMRHETYRAELQNALDRGALAAAEFGQQLEPQPILDDYIANSRKWNDTKPPVATVTEYINLETRRKVGVQATVEFDTIFLRLVGIPTMSVIAQGSAEQRQANLEISLVLDVSSSMRQSSRLYDMREAAKKFVSTMLQGDRMNRTTISLVPYAGQVNVGPLSNYYSVTNTNPYGNCIELDGGNYGSTGLGTANLGENDLQQVGDFTDADWLTIDAYAYDEDTDSMQPTGVDLGDFSEPGLDPTITRDEMDFFNYGWENDLTNDFNDPNETGTPDGSTYGAQRWGWCPADESAIVPFSNNISDLHTAIDGLVAHEATGIQYGLAWGAALLSPDMAPVLEDMLADGTVTLLTSDGSQSDELDLRPSTFDDEDNEKYLVFLTDGQITGQDRLKSDFYTNDDTSWPYYNLVGDTWEYAGYYKTTSWKERWGTPNRRNFASSKIGDVRPLETLTTRVQSTMLSLAQCKAIRDEGVVLFTIGFEINPNEAGIDDGEQGRRQNAAALMKACATTDEYSYEADGTNIEQTFDTIAETINKLRLTQ